MGAMLGRATARGHRTRMAARVDARRRRAMDG